MAKKPIVKKKKTVSRNREVPLQSGNGAPLDKTSPGLIKQALAACGGILRLAPTWVPRSFLMPGRRLKLAPQDVYALGAHRGGIDERWFGSTTAAANEGAPNDEGLSYVMLPGNKSTTLYDAKGSKEAF